MEIYGFHLKLSCFTPTSSIDPSTSFLLSPRDDWETRLCVCNDKLRPCQLKLVKWNLTALFVFALGGTPWLSRRYSWWCSFWKLYLYGEPNERKLGEGSTKQIKSEKEKGGERGVHILLLLVEFRNFMNSNFELKQTLREGKGRVIQYMKSPTVLQRCQGRCFIIL